jgi:hypothetical protein
MMIAPAKLTSSKVALRVNPLTHALAINPASGDIYGSSGSGIEVYMPSDANSANAWKHFSNQRVGDLAFAP